ncbi:aminotransferase class III-fold pyridoxal phosphate-dependent enzyme [Micromonospora sp. DH15]|nr:aminotransferase class III-fold pyridoxal phosphate-dependent enzyme [Micromonospora sp. DH15]
MEHRTSRQHVVDMCRTMLARGYLKATEGNVSVRVPGHELYAVTPSNYDYDRMRVEDVCIVDFAGKHVPDGSGTGLAPSIECGMHANIYRQRPDVNAIVHTHQPYASALAFLRRPIPALTDEQVRFLGKRVAIVDYAPSGTGFLARNVQKKVAGGDNAFIIANHGIVALGTDPDRAVFNMALLEKVSIAYLLALTTETGKVYTIPTAIREVAFGKLRADEKRIAAQITEAVPRDFNAKVRQLCDEFGALLIFDEVVTGFRLGLGGAAGYFGVTPDLTVLGKAVSGGYPMAGGVGGRADVMAVFGSGLDGKSGAHIQVGGTLSANPLSCAAGYFAIEEMARTNAPVIAGRAGDRLTRGLQRLIDRYGLPYVAYNQGSIVHLECSGVMLLDMRHPVKLLKENKARKRLMEQMGAAYAAHGIITLAGSRMYTSMADTDEVIDDALARFDQVFALVEGV